MAHPSPDPQRARRPGPPQSGFTLIELLVVLAMAGVLMLIGAPALFNIAGLYKVRSSARQLEMLARQARYEAIKMGQPVTVVGDSQNNMFYVISGTIAGMPPYAFPDGPTNIPPTQRVAVWQVPRGVTFAILPACAASAFCQAFQFDSAGSGTGQTVTFSSGNQPDSKVILALPPATTSTLGKLYVK